MREKAAVAKASNLGKLEFSNACLFHLYQALRHIPVVKRLYPALQKGWARLTWTGGYRVKRYRGVLFLVNYRNFSDRKIALQGSYESAKCNYLLSEMETGCDVFLDIGASMGIYALQVAQRGLAKEIHAFEPDPRNYAQLIANIYLNKFTSLIHAHQVALSSMSGPIQFEMATDAKTNLTQVASPSHTAATKTTEVMGHLTPGTGKMCELMARTLDEILFYQGKKIFIKIDIQGHELDALKGATQLLRNNPCFLQVAMWPENEARVLQQLAEVGYKVAHVIGNDYYVSK